MNSQDSQWMELALKEARKAAQKNEVPVGAVLVDSNGKLISKAHNLRESLKSPLGHAELLALHRAAKKIQGWRLTDLTLYCTLEPCIMCSGALIQSRMRRVVFGTLDPKGGALGSLYDLSQDPRLNHQFEISHGVLEIECSKILKDFFRNRRSTKASEWRKK